VRGYRHAVATADHLRPLQPELLTARHARPGVESETGRLHSVLVHRPGAELLAVDAANAGRMLFAGPVDLGRAQEQHDALVETLSAMGVEVLYVEELLTQALDDAERRRTLLDAVIGGARASLRRRLEGRAPRSIARALVGGLRESDLPLSPAGEGQTQILRPLPNLMFTRDPSVWLGPGVVVGEMATQARRREPRLFQALYRAHPRFAGAPTWTSRPAWATPVEGGDVLVVGRGRVAVGISSRTSTSGAARLAATLLARGVAREVLSIRVPRGAGFHLDLVLSMVDRESFAVWAPARHALRAHRWQATSTGIAVAAVPDPFRWLARSGRIIEIGGGSPERHGRSWDRGINVLAVAPGVVVAYADNREANARLRAAGIEVIPVSGSALARGCGGPRCLTCPLSRAPLAAA
jgi:arginine deiminase